MDPKRNDIVETANGVFGMPSIDFAELRSGIVSSGPLRKSSLSRMRCSKPPKLADATTGDVAMRDGRRGMLKSRYEVEPP